jgi:serine/threonine protein kinase
MTDDFGHYRVVGEIGRGGMGIVYQAIDTTTDRVVAIKQLVFANIDPTKKKEFKDRFRREAATAQRLSHPNIVTVYDVSTTGDNYFYVMEFLEGQSLRRELESRGGKMTALEYLPIFRQVAQGLSFAHTMNVVHRDVKPDNIFILNDGKVKITDFGIARATDFEQTHLTKTGVMLGTLAYVSPEQLQDAKSVDHRADIFSLGVVSYESLSGQIPFDGDGIAQTIVKIVSQEERPLHLVNPEITVEISAVVAKAMRKRVKERYRTAVDFEREFEQNLGAPVDLNLITQENLLRTQVDGAVIPSFDRQTFIELGAGDFGQISALQGGQTRSSQDKKLARSSEPSFEPVMTGRLKSTQTPNLKVDNSLGNFQKREPLLVISQLGKSNALLQEPTAICSRPGGLILADSGARKIHHFTLDGRWLGEFTYRPELKEYRTLGGAVTRPSGIAVDRRGFAYVTDSSDQFVRIFDSRGIFLKDFKNIQGKEGGLQGVTIDLTGTLYLSESAGACLQAFQGELGLWQKRIGVKDDGSKLIQLPAGLCCDRLNQIYCADYGASKIFVFSKAGQLIRSFGGRGSANGLFNVPRAVAVDRHDKIYVLDSLNHRIQVFGPTGSWLYSFGGRGSEPGKFIGPSDLTISQEANLLMVADKGNHRIQIFELD